MVNLTRTVERIIAGEMSERFGLILDGWTHAFEHCIAVYARYEVHGAVKTPLLCMAPLLNEEEEDLSARGTWSFLPPCCREIMESCWTSAAFSSLTIVQ
ncbi:hypothetical protein PI125_g15862 [Phytophthora idaei]|nr:hypothetical protein PI125_g15862 [Phytophthora idaei]KAG3144616.1 hypothetical protein PI126_g14089 [Phytophthora idaei]